MSRSRRKTTTFYLTIILVLFLMLASSVTLAYFALIRPTSEPMIYGEVNMGEEMAGVNIGYAVDAPLIIYSMLWSPRLAGPVSTPVTLKIYLDGNEYLTTSCSPRTVQTYVERLILCAVSVIPKDLPSGRHRLDAYITDTVIGGRLITNAWLVTVVYTKSDSVIVLNEVRYSPPISLSRYGVS